MDLTSNGYVDTAEKVIKSMITTDKTGKKTLPITTSKIRNLLQLITELYNDVVNSTEEKLSEKQLEKVQYLKIRFIYEAGRDEKGVGVLVKEAKIIEYLNKIGDKKKVYISFTRYMEALVAYHKYYGGKD